MSVPKHGKNEQCVSPLWQRPPALVCLQPPRRFAFFLLQCCKHGDQPQRFQWRAGSKYHANFILAGTARYQDGQGREQMLGPGDCYQHHPDQSGSLETIGGSDFIEFYLVLDQQLAAAFQHMGAIPRQGIIHGGDRTLFTRHFERLYAFGTQAEQLPRSSMCCRLAALVDDCFRDLITSSRRRSPHASAVQRAAELLARPEWDRQPLPGLAEEVGLSYATLRRAFSAIEGMSLVHYRLLARLRRGAGMLLEGASVETSASAIGYSEPFTFSQQFKQVYGVSPREYQRRYRL